MPEDPLTAALQFAHEQHARHLDELSAFLRIPSISSRPEHADDMRRAAGWLAERLRVLGMDDVQILATGGHPVVVGDWLQAADNAPTILIYGHYDVQPAEPLDDWQSDPFDPALRDDYLFARGASDMKGQVMATLNAVEALLRNGGLPVNVKFLIEGEEELGSVHLGPFIAEHRRRLACDYALNVDAGMLGPELPTIVYGLRGGVVWELHVHGPSHDVHSGLYGGVIHNPAQALCELVAGLHDDQGRVTIPGFYDRVRPVDREERAAFARLPMDGEFFLRQTGAPALWGEPDFTPLERVTTRPTLELNGIRSGSAKSAVPATATAYFSMRLVPDQDPAEIEALLRGHLEAQLPPTVRWEANVRFAIPASLTDRTAPGVRSLSQALEQVWGVQPVFARQGGGIPVVRQLQDILGVDSVLSGFGLPDDNIHGPNERLHLPTWRRGIDALIHYFHLAAQV